MIDVRIWLGAEVTGRDFDVCFTSDSGRLPEYPKESAVDPKQTLKLTATFA